MGSFFACDRWMLRGLCLCVVMGAGSAAASADVLSSNLTGAAGGAETAQGTLWLCAGFTTGATTYRLDSITIPLSSIAGAAEMDIYSDSGLEPGSLVGVMTAPGTYSSGLTTTTFTANSILLSASSSYWVILKAVSGAFSWGWTTANAGTGTGYANVWGQAADSGAIWYTTNVFPLQMAVNVTPAAPGTVKGRLALEGVADLSAAKPAASTGALQILFRAPGATTTLYAASAALTPVGTGSAFGAYTASIFVPAGTYDVVLKTAKNLQVAQYNVLVYGATSLADATLPAGDADNNNMVDIQDFGALVNAYGGDSAVTGSDYDPAADFNADGMVDVLDFGLLVNNYGSTGAP